MALCDFNESNGYCECPTCGRRVKKTQHPCSNHYATCRGESGQGVGDWVENWLTSWGMTKDKYVELKEKLGLPPTCHCTGRQEWLNRAGAYLGIAADRYGPNRKKNNGS